jgi:hypothetical protein
MLRANGLVSLAVAVQIGGNQALGAIQRDVRSGRERCCTFTCPEQNGDPISNAPERVTASTAASKLPPPFPARNQTPVLPVATDVQNAVVVEVADH